MKTLYLECMSGISGDMTVAALLDLGADEQVLRDGLASLQVDGYDIRISRVSKSGISACDFSVHLHNMGGHDDAHVHSDDGHHHTHDDHDHSHHSHAHDDHHHPHHGDTSGEHPHSHSFPAPDHEHVHPTLHTHTSRDHDGHDHSHHRNLSDINAIIDASAITRNAKEMAKKIFRVIACAEAKVHGLPVEEVHFHEVGAVDSIVDIVGAAICIDNLGPDRILCSPLREGTGMVKCQHGLMPIPAPATMEIVRAHRIPLIITGNKGEMVTPTGAGIVAALADRFAHPDGMEILSVGYGAGKRDFACTANLLRACIIREESTPAQTDTVVKLECNIDDLSGEIMAYACGKLFDAGALDVWCTPIYMKKNRPGQMLSALLPKDCVDAALAVLFYHTTTAGVRVSEHLRHTMQRRAVSLSTPYGPVAAKELTWGDICKTQVEYESAKALAEAANISINEIFRSAYSE